VVAIRGGCVEHWIGHRNSFVGPLLLLSDVTKLKEKVFRESYLSASTDEEESLILCEPAIDGEKSFNAAKFLFPSW
jgi:hypothetical protein